jgi:NDP-sugar pyrophosphorylase family protein
MQIVIPMSGFGERFRAVGYETPKPLIEVEGKPIIAHVLDMFPGVSKVVFICNADHLSKDAYRMQEILTSICPDGVIVPIAAHKLGPVHAVLSALDHLNLEEPVVVNYADFTCRWSFSDFERFVIENDLDAAVPAYRGFHPHSGGTTNYAYIRESDGGLLEIREKQPFTEKKTEEFASSGTYYFKSGNLMESCFREQISKQLNVAGEFYVSSAINLVAQSGLSVGVYEIQHFMQWGTPQDLAEYVYWSDLFRRLASFRSESIEIKGIDYLGILAGGLGVRFQEVGYNRHKSLLLIGGRPVLEQVSRMAKTRANFVAVRGSEVAHHIAKGGLGNLVEIDHLSDGQARSAKLLVDNAKPQIGQSVTIVSSDNLYLDHAGLPDRFSGQDSTDSIVIWATEPTPYALEKPENFGWIRFSGSELSTSLKKAPDFTGAKVISGSFTFSSLDVLERLTQHLFSSDNKINGEYYLDSLVLIAKELGIDVEIFEPIISISLGTPYEFETFRYWQSCFDRWSSHPYSIEDDPFISESDFAKVRKELGETKHQPSEWA